MRLSIRSLISVSVLALSNCSGGGGGGGTGGGNGGGSGGNNGSTVTINWTFDGKTCAEQSALSGIPAIAKLSVDLNGQTHGDLGCTNGSAGDGVALNGIANGTAAYTVHATSAQGEELFRGTGSVNVNGATSSAVTLNALKGGLAFRWHFWDGANYVDCVDAGVSNITVNLKHAMSGELLYGDAGTMMACPTAFGDGLQLPWVAPGRYFIYLEARDAANTLYGTDPISPPRADVDAGVYPTVDDVAQPAELYKQ